MIEWKKVKDEFPPLKEKFFILSVNRSCIYSTCLRCPYLDNKKYNPSYYEYLCHKGDYREDDRWHELTEDRYWINIDLPKDQ